MGLTGALPGALAVVPLAAAAALAGTLLGPAAAAIWLPAAALLWWLHPGTGSGTTGSGTTGSGTTGGSGAVAGPHPLVVLGVVAAAGLLPVLALRIRRAWASRGERLRVEARAAAAAAERARLAREMHDSLSKTLDAIALGAAALPDTLAEPDRASRLAATLRDGTLDAARDARVLIDELRSNPADAPLADLVAAIGQEWSVTSGVGVILHNTDVDAAPEVGIELCWILREALRNVAAHARAELVAVTLTRAGGEVTLEVRDDGDGFTVPDELGRLHHAGSHGLVGMTERARLCGGALTVWSRPGAGTRVTATVPAEPAPVGAPPSRRLRLLVGTAAAALPVALILPFSGAAEPPRDQLAVPSAGPGRSLMTAQAPAGSAAAVPPPASGPTVAPAASRPPKTAAPTSSSPPPAAGIPGVGGSSGTDAANTCKVRYSKRNEWNPGFVADVVVTNSGTKAIDGWSLRFEYSSGQKLISYWGAIATQTGASVVVEDGGVTPKLAPGATLTFGLQGTWQGANPAPTVFTLNGVRCG
ncbi:cellulose binding domain-containing protein [Dactylosporangium aurantiacum]|uniref:histidine kinase n=1 Tax=Dactylosporangium aurantiacum TaxID=35754 RepID=A0A9Q9IKW5_9ACTN|nr:cellulose binding domain-containing protein [Dactylosporangium aurantiacum]MDG6100690.1 cellulose binding domain-containing protein [Dactylosporangium aurantiacum]UWZ55234.1 cellulose binding domain-containing protein [Dactylosporangium aurantiacum]